MEEIKRKKLFLRSLFGKSLSSNILVYPYRNKAVDFFLKEGKVVNLIHISNSIALMSAIFLLYKDII